MEEILETKSVQLPIKNKVGYYEIRLESIGGLGANLCGKMLGELGIKYLGLNSASFSSYGSEKTGTPVKAFIRYADMDKEIRVHSPVVNPHLLCIFHDALLQNPSVLSGCTKDTVIVVNTPESEEKTLKRITCDNQDVICIPAQKIAMETGSRINVVMLGAMARTMGFASLEAVSQICRDSLGRKYPDALKGNLEGIKRGYLAAKAALKEEEAKKEQAQEKEQEQKQDKEQKQEKEHDENRWDKRFNNAGNNIEENVDEQEWGYETAPVGGINTRIGNSVIADLSASRQGYIPVFLQDRCINCGLCDSTCPDMVFQFKEGVYKGREMMVNAGLDYYHCKGCLRCVSVCPTQALIKGMEADYPIKKWFVPNQDLLRSPDYYESSGADGYITSESFLTEKRMEGGEV